MCLVCTDLRSWHDQLRKAERRLLVLPSPGGKLWHWKHRTVAPELSTLLFTVKRGERHLMTEHGKSRCRRPYFCLLAARPRFAGLECRAGRGAVRCGCSPRGVTAGQGSARSAPRALAPPEGSPREGEAVPCSCVCQVLFYGRGKAGFRSILSCVSLSVSKSL